MASRTSGSVSKTAKKRKREAGVESAKKRAKSESSDEEDDQQSRILLLENEILESKKHYNNIVALVDILKKHDDDVDSAVVAAVSLCRVFIRLLGSGRLAKRKDMPEKDAVVVRWLRDRLSEYKEALLPLLQIDEAALTALTLAMRVLKAEAQHFNETEEYFFPRTFLTGLVGAMVEPSVDEAVRAEFLEKFVDEYDDIRFYTFQAIKNLLERTISESGEEAVLDNLFDMLIAIDGVPDSADELEDFYVDQPKQKKHALFSLSQHKKQAQEAWQVFLSLGLNKDQKKRVLDVMATSIAPWFTKPELLMDFLTDCYDEGGAISLLALSGVFYLIQHRNLDYPLFYRKLYSLLDADILHSKHRSRFFRLLDTFLASSHLPAVLVASFIKRLARLSLNAPPAAIVVIVPWFYNLFKKHPLTTFMMHRVPRTEEEKEQLENEGMDDPFLPDEPDPMKTNAIDSCIWEIVQLQSHYHPNVATIAKIVSEQFTKEFYNLEDFLDHSYGSLFEAEIHKQVKKVPVVEYMIPKKVLTPVEKGSEEKDSLLASLWDFGSS